MTTLNAPIVAMAAIAIGMSVAGCTTAGYDMKNEWRASATCPSGSPDDKGYRFEQASQFIEFCVELDSQDDRSTSPGDPRYIPDIDPDRWNPVPVFDSRQRVAHDLIAFRESGETPQNRSWAKLYKDTLERAAADNPSAQWTEDTLAHDARYNGFGPYQSAWLLYEGRNGNAGAYAIAVRGTVFSARPSVVEDALFHPVLAQHFLSPEVTFADAPGASLHSGFAHGTFSLMLDDRYGILRVLHDMSDAIHPGARLYVVGHSQGAAMAILVHAFLHYAMANANAQNDAFDLYDRHYLLKTYVFALPKVGNYAFSTDFAHITQPFDNAIVINNDLDLVPQVPLTLEDLGDLGGDLPGTALPVRLLRYLAGIGSGLRGAVSRVAEPFVRKDDLGYGDYFNRPRLGRIDKDRTGPSWNFLPAGHVMYVFGTPGDPNDIFLQHHAWMYRELVRAQLHDGDGGRQ